MYQHTKFWYLTHHQATKAQAHVRIWADAQVP